ncbi:hypothetical protein FRC08_002274 [Ceratobasidium sp. 394]|nr:hypothetical protein FRC08_002274 [Ceratobasidium sp. 394]KAG9094859.1 hypothetical protein FS749_011694 [Ceratobasidium sp. UAMH 11750]
MSRTLPNEIVLNISAQVGRDSSLDLKPLTLVDHQWHTVVSPSLLSTITVSSLGNLLELCDHLVSLNEHSSNAFQSAMPKNTTTIVIDGVIWAPRADCHVGLQDLGEVGRGDEEDTDDPDEPDISVSFEEVVSKLGTALPLLTALDGVEWYGRFAGDYHLVRYLQKAKVIRHVSYGIDMQVSSVSLAYRENAFLFENLKTLKITSEYEPEADMFPFITNMMHRNPDLEEILFDCKYAESMGGRWSLQEVICKDQKPFVWPNLKRLVLRFFRGGLWQSAEEVDQLVEFLVTHPHLETLVLRETCPEDSQSETALPLSLSTHPGSLPVLKKLLGSPRLIAGILESPAACASLTTIIDNSEEGFDSDGAKAPYINRILAALKKVPGNSIRRCTLEVPQLSRSVYGAFADAGPNIQFVEFLKDRLSLEKATCQAKDFNPVDDIPASLNAFPRLDTVGSEIVADFIRASGEDREAALIEFATRVSRLKAIHCGQGSFLTISRSVDGVPSISKEPVYLDNSDYDWMTFAVDWRHRPMSRRKVLEVWRSDGGEFEDLMNRFD